MGQRPLVISNSSKIPDGRVWSASVVSTRHLQFETLAVRVICCGRHQVTRDLEKQICQLETLEYFTRREQLMTDQCAVQIGRGDLLGYFFLRPCQFHVIIPFIEITTGINSGKTNSQNPRP